MPTSKKSPASGTFLSFAMSVYLTVSGVPRYLYRYYREGTLHTERAANAREECKKIKNISKTVSQVRSLTSGPKLPKLTPLYLSCS